MYREHNNPYEPFPGVTHTTSPVLPVNHAHNNHEPVDPFSTEGAAEHDNFPIQIKYKGWLLLDQHPGERSCRVHLQ